MAYKTPRRSPLHVVLGLFTPGVAEINHGLEEDPQKIFNSLQLPLPSLPLH